VFGVAHNAVIINERLSWSHNICEKLGVHMCTDACACTHALTHRLDLGCCKYQGNACALRRSPTNRSNSMCGPKSHTQSGLSYPSLFKVVLPLLPDKVHIYQCASQDSVPCLFISSPLLPQRCLWSDNTGIEEDMTSLNAHCVWACVALFPKHRTCMISLHPFCWMNLIMSFCSEHVEARRMKDCIIKIAWSICN
jgi:hypothetical protein